MISLFTIFVLTCSGTSNSDDRRSICQLYGVCVTTCIGDGSCSNEENILCETTHDVFDYTYDGCDAWSDTLVGFEKWEKCFNNSGVGMVVSCNEPWWWGWQLPIGNSSDALDPVYDERESFCEWYDLCETYCFGGDGTCKNALCFTKPDMLAYEFDDCDAYADTLSGFEEWGTCFNNSGVGMIVNCTEPHWWFDTDSPTYSPDSDDDFEPDCQNNDMCLTYCPGDVMCEEKFNCWESGYNLDDFGFVDCDAFYMDLADYYANFEGWGSCFNNSGTGTMATCNGTSPTSVDPEPTDDSANPDSTDDSVIPESTDDSANPESTDDSANPEPTDDSANPEPTDDSANSETSDDNDTEHDCKNYDLCITMCSGNSICEDVPCNTSGLNLDDIGYDDCDSFQMDAPNDFAAFEEWGSCFDNNGVGYIVTCNVGNSSSGSDTVTGMIIGIIVGVILLVGMTMVLLCGRISLDI